MILIVGLFVMLGLNNVMWFCGLFLQNTPGNVTGEEQGQANRSYCRICKCGENEGSEKAQKMLSCKSCSKKYHRNCLRSWGRNRGKVAHVYVGVVLSAVYSHVMDSFLADLFHWSSWTCPLCRICEVRSGV